VELTCRQCERPLPRLRRGGRPSRFCSPECRAEARRARSGVLGQVTPTPFATALHRAVDGSGLSLRALEHRLADFGVLVAASTVDDWRHGIRTPVEGTDTIGRMLALERVLGVPAGDLVVALERTRRGAPAPPPARGLAQITGSGSRSGSELAQRLTTLQRRVAALSGRQVLLPVRVRYEHEIGLDRRPMRSTVSQVGRAAHDDVDRCWFLHAFSRRLHADVHPATGCRLGRIMLDRPSGPDDLVLAAVELLFDDLLVRGQWYELSFTVLFGHGHEERMPEPALRQVQAEPSERVELRLTFPPGAGPARVWEHRWTPVPAFVETREPVAVPLDQHAATIVLTDCPPAAAGWTWEWPD
jgi:hypothetical protein